MLPSDRHKSSISGLSNERVVSMGYCGALQVIDYRTQQYRLFPLLATVYAYRIVGFWMKWLYADVTERLNNSDFSTLPEVHACTAGLKSMTTSITAVSLLLHCMPLPSLIVDEYVSKCDLQTFWEGVLGWNRGVPQVMWRAWLFVCKWPSRIVCCICSSLHI
jgi:hypothetical protein